jgi:hypothetical protein
MDKKMSIPIALEVDLPTALKVKSKPRKGLIKVKVGNSCIARPYRAIIHST